MARLDLWPVKRYATASSDAAGQNALNLPVVFGPLAITYNLSAVDVLTLDAPTLARIFSGTIDAMDDPAITALNGSMPAEDIHVVYRSDESGTIDNFQRTSKLPRRGHGTAVTARCFRAGRVEVLPERGPSAMVKNTEGAISYNEWSFAMDQDGRG